MPIETRPDLHDLCEAQRIIGLAHWYTWLMGEHLGLIGEDLGHNLRHIEVNLQPETALRLASARTRYFRDSVTASIDVS